MRRNFRQRFIGLSVIAAATIGCVGDDESRPFTDRIASLNTDLAPGSTGEDVRTVNEYLTRFGYFPNLDLAREFPAWRPIVAVAPTDPQVFGRPTAEAVRRLQANNGLPVTGIVDNATRDTMKRLRCGVPDGIEALDADDKFALKGISVTSRNFLFEVLNGVGGITANDVASAIMRTQSAWSNQSEVLFTKATSSGTGTNSNPRIKVQFTSLPAGTAASTVGGGTCCPLIKLNSSVPWSVNIFPPAPPNTQDLQTALLHHLGHAVGLDHSAFPSATMLPPLPVGLDWTIDVDDRRAISTAWDRYTTVIGAAFDIGAGADGSIWVVGDNAFMAGFGVWKWNGSNGWDQDIDRGAVRIAVLPDGRPVIVDNGGEIWARDSGVLSTRGWHQLNQFARAKDIGAGANGDIWIIGTNPIGFGFGIWKFNGSNDWTPDPLNQAGTKISVSPTGRPWVLNGGAVYRRSSNNVFDGSWQQVPNASNMKDIGVGAFGDPAFDGDGAVVYVVNNTQLYILDEQPGSGSGENAIPARQAWLLAGDTRSAFGAQRPDGFLAGQVAVVPDFASPQGVPWVLGTDKTIHRPTR